MQLGAGSIMRQSSRGGDQLLTAHAAPAAAGAIM
jgi:hypothetical protein